MDVQQTIPVTMCLSKVTLAAGTTTTLSNTGTTTYSVRGKAYTKAAMTNAATPTTDAATGAAFLPVPANFGSVYTIGFNAAGSLLAVQGNVVPLDGNGAFINAPQFGGLPLDFCPIGYLVIKAGATASSAPGWLFGTNNMSGVTGITYTFVDVIGLPDRPQVS
jgi:hypothetical protein